MRTPEPYFVEIIEGLRRRAGRELPVSIFSDGRPDELPLLASLPGITFVEGNPDIVDLLLLSRSDIVVTSAASTFSYWAGFLSDSPLILHPSHIHQPVRGDERLYEGPWKRLGRMGRSLARRTRSCPGARPAQRAASLRRVGGF